MSGDRTLLAQARVVLERYLFDEETIRDDVASICMKIDDTLSDGSDGLPAMNHLTDRAA
jgi:hypothetical protein